MEVDIKNNLHAFLFLVIYQFHNKICHISNFKLLLNIIILWAILASHYHTSLLLGVFHDGPYILVDLT